jgi:hypothetical protein
MAAMRAAKERLRMARAGEAREVGRVTFAGPRFGGEHVVRCLDAGDFAHLWVEVDGKAHWAKTWRGVMRLVCRRMGRV